MCCQRFNVHFYRSGFLFTFIHIRTVQIFSMLLNHLLSKCNSNQFCYLFYFKSCFGFLNSFSYQCAAFIISLRVNDSNFHRTRYKALKIFVTAKTFIRKKKELLTNINVIFIWICVIKKYFFAIYYAADLNFSRFLCFVSCQISDLNTSISLIQSQTIFDFKT